MLQKLLRLHLNETSGANLSTKLLSDYLYYFFKVIWVIQNSASLFHRQKSQRSITGEKQNSSLDLFLMHQASTAANDKMLHLTFDISDLRIHIHNPDNFLKQTQDALKQFLNWREGMCVKKW